MGVENEVAFFGGTVRRMFTRYLITGNLSRSPAIINRTIIGDGWRGRYVDHPSNSGILLDITEMHEFNPTQRLSEMRAALFKEALLVSRKQYEMCVFTKDGQTIYRRWTPAGYKNMTRQQLVRRWKAHSTGN